MKVLEAHGKPTRRPPPWLLGVGAIVVLGLVAGVAFALGSSSSPPKNTSGSGSTHTGGGGTKGHSTTTSLPTLSIASSSPAANATDVASNADISITFSKPIRAAAVQPTLAPAVAGRWVQDGASTLRFDADAPLIPASTETITLPSGTHGIRGSDGSALAPGSSFGFTVADGDTMRLQELLAQLNFLPLSFAPTGGTPAGKDMAQSQPGSFNWRWSTLPANLTSQWMPGTETVITKAAVMAFENQNGLTVDGLPGPSVWTALLKDVATDKADTVPYVYVLVNKVQPENLTLYNDGAPEYSNVLVNTGAPGADTTDGTYAVFEHVVSSDMKGTNPNGTTYDDPNVPYASYFNGGDALHGFIRAKYGFPQSNGCVEMSYANAAMVWPLTPIGTLVTVVGPASPALPTTTTTTTTTTAPPATTTTTAPPAA
jgi:peptidoglycan hydrolase-like protein with peptidoglycan-binding domain